MTQKKAKNMRILVHFMMHLWVQNCGPTHSTPRHCMIERGYIYVPAALAADKNLDTRWRLGGPQASLEGTGNIKSLSPVGMHQDKIGISYVYWTVHHLVS